MALGNYNNNKNEVYSPTVYSPYTLFNSEHPVVKSGLSATMWKNMLKFTFGMYDEKTNKWNFEDGIEVYLSHLQARQMLNEIIAFQETGFANGGVATNTGLLTISNGSEYTGKSTDNCLSVRKIDPENGTVSASAVYFFNKSHYTIRDYDEDTMKFEKEYCETLEIEVIKTLLEEYYKAATGAYAAANLEHSKFQAARMDNKINAISEALGIKMEKKGSSSNSGGKSYFDGGGKQGAPSRSGNLDDL